MHAIKENTSHALVTTELFQDLSESHGKSGGANLQLHASRGISLQCCEGMQMSRWHVLYQTNLFIFSVIFCPIPVFVVFFSSFFSMYRKEIGNESINHVNLMAAFCSR